MSQVPISQIFKFFKLSTFMLASVLAGSLLIAGCSSKSDRKEAQVQAHKADAQLAGEIQSRLNSDPLLTANQRSSVGVRVQGGVATLSGWVTTDSELSAALAAAQGVEGVKQVVSRLQVGQEFAGMPGAAPAYANALEEVEPRYEPRVTRKPTAQRAPARSAGRTTMTPAVNTRANANQSGGFNPYNNGGQVTQTSPAPVYSAPATPVASATPAYQEPVYREPQRINIPAGTEISVRLIDSLSSETSSPDQRWRGTVNGDIVVEDRTVIPSGSEVQGRIVEVKKSTHYTGAAQLTLEMSRVTFGGKSYTVASDQWTRKGAARGGNTAKKVGSGAAIGAVLGGIFGGGKGAAIGAAAGAGAGAGANTITKGEKVELDSESLIMFRLASAVSVVPSAVRERSYTEPARQYVPPAVTPERSDEDAYRPVLKRRG